jgi:hypothetical protein
MIFKELPMLNKSLVLVLGAGASNEVGLPVGADLKHQIAKKLDFKFDDVGRPENSGDDEIMRAFQVAKTGPDVYPANKQSLIKASCLIRDAMPMAISIDNFIDSHRNDELVAFCGKLAIARCILEEEARSKLFINPSNINNKLNFGGIQNTWFNAFFQLLTENCQKENLPERLQKVAVVSFNYDRCFEHCLYFWLQQYYGISKDEAASIVALLEVHHPYGSVGALPWMTQSKKEKIEYGATPNAHQLITISKLLRTFTEGTDSSVSDIESIRATVANAERLLILGFAFHRLNLDLLFSGLPSRTTSVFATAFGLSQSNSDQIKDSFSDKAQFIQIRNDLTCTKLISEYSRRLSLNLS